MEKYFFNISSLAAVEFTRIITVFHRIHLKIRALAALWAHCLHVSVPWESVFKLKRSQNGNCTCYSRNLFNASFHCQLPRLASGYYLGQRTCRNSGVEAHAARICSILKPRGLWTPCPARIFPSESFFILFKSRDMSSCLIIVLSKAKRLNEYHSWGPPQITDR